MIFPVQETRIDYKGFPCVVLFMPHGWRCGYVGLPKGNKYYKVNYSLIPIGCHCGLSYSASTLQCQTDTDMWWIGFDCNHHCDGWDLDTAKEYFKGNEGLEKFYKAAEESGLLETRNQHKTAKTVEYVLENCKGIVDQILESEVNEDA